MRHFGRENWKRFSSQRLRVYSEGPKTRLPRVRMQAVQTALWDSGVRSGYFRQKDQGKFSGEGRALHLVRRAMSRDEKDTLGRVEFWFSLLPFLTAPWISAEHILYFVTAYSFRQLYIRCLHLPSLDSTHHSRGLCVFSSPLYTYTYST